jgi:hypothetical protein
VYAVNDDWFKENSPVVGFSGEFVDHADRGEGRLVEGLGERYGGDMASRDARGARGVPS